MSSYPSAAMADQFDTGPLSWVMEEIRAALARTAALALSSAGLDADAASAALREGVKVLHQAHGALQVVDIAGAPLLTEAIEDLLTRAADAAPAPEPGYREAIAAACGALTEYLDELLAGASPQALKLYPYYRDLQQARAISRVHPSDLYFPDLSVRPRLAGPEVQASPAETAQLRQRFEKALLPLLKSTEAQAERAGAAGLADVLADFVRRAPGRCGRAYWWVLHGFAAGVASGEIASAVHVKQLFGRINMQTAQARRADVGSRRAADAGRAVFHCDRAASFAAAAADTPGLWPGAGRRGRVAKRRVRPHRPRSDGRRAGTPAVGQGRLGTPRRRRTPGRRRIRPRHCRDRGSRCQPGVGAARPAAGAVDADRGRRHGGRAGAGAGAGRGHRLVIPRKQAGRQRPSRRRHGPDRRRHGRPAGRAGQGRAAVRAAAMVGQRHRRRRAARNGGDPRRRNAQQPGPGREIAGRVLQQLGQAHRAGAGRRHPAPDRRRAGDTRPA